MSDPNLSPDGPPGPSDPRLVTMSAPADGKWKIPLDPPEVTRLNEGVEVKVLRKDGDWIECKSGRFEDGWIHVSSVKDI